MGIYVICGDGLPELRLKTLLMKSSIVLPGSFGTYAEGTVWIEGLVSKKVFT